MNESVSEKLMTHTEFQTLWQDIDPCLRTKDENVDKPPLLLSMTTKAYTTENSKDSLPDRVFNKRNSLLTEMFKQNHIRTIRHIFISIMVILALQVFVSDSVENGSINLNFELISWAFDKFEVVCYTWFYMMMSTSCLVYYSFHSWSNDRIKRFPTDASNLFKYDLIWLTLYCIYLVLFILLPSYVVVANRLPAASAFIVLLEQLRLLMKTHAFVRSNASRALENGRKRIETLNIRRHRKTNSLTLDNHDDSSSDEEIISKKIKNEFKLCPDFTNYLYFLFAPTLIYRDEYPRNSSIRWKNVWSNFVHVFGTIIFAHYILSRFCIPMFKNFNADSITLKFFIQSILNCTWPGILILIIEFYGFQHCWMNAWAEMLRFSDRLFYKDWWNSSNFSNYYRTWNVVVHDWLYTYIYKDLFYLLGSKKKTLCQFGIFFISAVSHEYALSLVFGFFYPLLIIEFGAIGFLCIFNKSKKKFMNLFLWLGLLVGMGGMVSLYSMEWYARKNCPSSLESKILDIFIPRSLTCGTRNFQNKSLNLDQMRNKL